MRQNLTNLVIVIGLLLLVTACFWRSEKSPTVNTPAAAPTVEGQPSNFIADQDNGDFKVDHGSPRSARFAEIDRQIRSAKLLEKAADKLNAALILPRDVTLRTSECGRVNAFYTPKDPSVTVCFELMDHFYKVFRSAGESSAEAYDQMFNAVRFVFLHEVGHALIDLYTLPITGNEEDAADRCSAYINIEYLGKDGVDAVLAAAKAFEIDSKRSGTDRLDLADEHLLQEQRFYNSLCMLYGSDTAKYQSLVTDRTLPPERAGRCQAEYSRSKSSWTSLLEPYRRK
ncbi:MAG: hypothetical protein UZ17_ACD001002324 [Acidobacteria bacterium OLB17]|nr:MAG: hypothetical protein UZ17_ACD001002324 [Acidobacteria bacterium OLB17]MCZ2389769.1 DUF4344 domain-containing metallopeptidase [Acidobacteriota bacterium]